MPVPHAAATRQLRRRLGTRVDLGEEARRAASFDSSRVSVVPAAVVTPRREEDVGVVLRLANRHRVPVTVRGRGTTLMGSAVPVHGGWVVDMTRLDRVTVEADAGLVRAQAGATTAAVQAAAARHGWFYPPDPSSRAWCTIGGNIACNAGGMHGGKYGVTRDFVVALRGYLPTGELVEWGTATRKFAAGFNLRDLWIGSEGLLGIVTSAVLKLVPEPAARWTILTAFADEGEALAAARALFRARAQPAICEFLDRESVTCAERALGATIFPGQAGRPVVLLEFAGGRAELAELKPRVLAWARAAARAHREARTRAQAERLWAVRRKCSSAMFELGDTKLNEDVVLPMRQYGRFARYLAALKRRARLPIPTFGHLADGNLHVNIMFHRRDRAEARRAEAAVADLMRTVVRLGGAISGEHGIGLAKTPFLRLQHSPAQVRAMQAVKRALDPRGICNPGKLFTPVVLWRRPKVAVSFPWDHK